MNNDNGSCIENRTDSFGGISSCDDIVVAGKKKDVRTILSCMGIDVGTDGFDWYFAETGIYRMLYQCQRFCSDYAGTLWHFVGTVVYQYTGIYSRPQESGAGNPDFTFESGYRAFVGRNRGLQKKLAIIDTEE